MAPLAAVLRAGLAGLVMSAREANLLGTRGIEAGRPAREPLAAHHHRPALARPADRGRRRRPARDPLRPRVVAALPGGPAHLPRRVGGDGDPVGEAVRPQRAGLLVGARAARRSGRRPRAAAPSRPGGRGGTSTTGSRPRCTAAARDRDGAAGARGRPRRRAARPVVAYLLEHNLASRVPPSGSGCSSPGGARTGPTPTPTRSGWCTSTASRPRAGRGDRGARVESRGAEVSTRPEAPTGASHARVTPVTGDTGGHT